MGKKRLGQLGGANTKIPRKLPKVASGGAGDVETKGGMPGALGPTQSGEKVASGGAGEVDGNSGPRGMQMLDGAKKASGTSMGEVAGNKTPAGSTATVAVHDKNRTTKGI